MIHKWTGLLAGLFIALLCLSGALVGIGSVAKSYAPVFVMARKFHKDFLLGQPGGGYLVGALSILMLVLVVTGYVLWGRSMRGFVRGAMGQGFSVWRGIGRGLTFRVPNRVLRWHVVAGIWSGILLVVMAVTGMTWSYGWWARFMVWLMGGAGDWGVFHTLAGWHTGAFGGISTRVLWIIAALAGVIMCVTGFWIFLKNFRAKRRKR